MRTLKLESGLIKKSSPAAYHPGLKNFPTPVRLLRFALTGSVTPTNDGPVNLKLSDHLKARFALRRLQLPPRLARDTPAPSFRTPKITKSQNLVSLQACLEGFVNSRQAGIELLELFPDLRNAIQSNYSQRDTRDVLALINGLLERFRKIDVERKELLSIGMTCAAQSLSVNPLRNYLKQYSDNEYGAFPSRFAIRLIKTLTSGLRRHIWEDPTIDKGQILSLVEGTENGDNAKLYSLRSLLDLSNVSRNTIIGDYLRLLGVLGDTTKLLEFWSIIETELPAHPTSTLVQTSISCAEAFIEVGNPEKAVEITLFASKYVELDEHTSSSFWKNILRYDSRGELRHVVNLETTLAMLEADIMPLERILGATWVGADEDDAHHLNLRTMEPFIDGSDTDNIYDPNLDDSRDISGLEVANQILSIIRGSGYSNSTERLSMLANVLDEHEGTEIHLESPHMDGFESSWFLQRSPIEFLGDRPSLSCDMTATPSPASLGLVRVRGVDNGTPMGGDKSLHLMQLGYIATRDAPGHEAGIRREPHDSTKWMPTGHIVALDRWSGNLVLIWLGKGSGTIEKGLIKPAPAKDIIPYPYGLITPQGSSSFQISPPAEHSTPLQHRRRFWVDVDPALDLSP